MKRNKLPSKKEWDNIINEAFSSYEDHRFSERYLQKKEKIEKTERGVIMKKSSNRPERLFIGLTTAAVLAAVAIPTAAITLNHMNDPGSPAAQLATEAVTESAEPTAENDVEVMPAVTSANSENNTTPDMNSQQTVSTTPMAISCNNLPKGFYIDKLELPDNEDQNATTQEYDLVTLIFYNGSGAIYADLYTIPENYTFTTNDYAPNIKNPDKTETFRIENKTVFLTRSLDFGKNNVADSAYIRDVWVKFDGSNYAVKIMATHDISDDDIKEFIKGLSLVPSKTEAPEWSYTPDIKEVPPENRYYRYK